MVSLPPASRGSAPEWVWNSAITSTSPSPLLEPFRQVAVLGKVEEAGELALEAHLYRAGRTVALLGYDDLGLAAHFVHVGFPLGIFERTRLGFLIPEIIF